MAKRISVLLPAAVLLVSCGPSGIDGGAGERADKVYQAAVADYTAGRIDAAIEGFEAAVRSDPGNANARFQLAVLLQDGRKDYLGAMCCYRDYGILSPGGDKKRLARERAAECERLLAAEFAGKYNLGDSAELNRRIEALKSEVSAAESARAALAKGFEEAKSRAASLERENARLKAVLKRMGEDEDGSAAPPPRPESVRTASGDGDDGAGAPRPAPPSVFASDGEEKPLGVNPEALAVFEEEEREAASRPPLPSVTSPARVAGGAKLTDIARTFGGGDGGGEAPSARTHVVEEGETLSMIALKYYGRKSAWRRIQDANKAIVAPDGKVKAGQELRIP